MEETEKKVIKVFTTSFNVDENKIQLTDTKNDIEAWDSIGHLHLIMNLETEFNIKMDTEDVVKIDSVEKCVDIVNKLLS